MRINLFTTFTAAVEFGNKILFNFSSFDIIEKCSIIDDILPIKHALLTLKVSHSNKKCLSSPTLQDVQNLQILEVAGTGGREYLSFSISKLWAEHLKRDKKDLWFLDCTRSM